MDEPNVEINPVSSAQPFRVSVEFLWQDKVGNMNSIIKYRFTTDKINGLVLANKANTWVDVAPARSAGVADLVCAKDEIHRLVDISSDGRQAVGSSEDPLQTGISWYLLN